MFAGIIIILIIITITTTIILIRRKKEITMLKILIIILVRGIKIKIRRRGRSRRRRMIRRRSSAHPSHKGQRQGSCLALAHSGRRRRSGPVHHVLEHRVRSCSVRPGLVWSGLV